MQRVNNIPSKFAFYFLANLFYYYNKLIGYCAVAHSRIYNKSMQRVYNIPSIFAL